jgi:hypothetical protein
MAESFTSYSIENDAAFKAGLQRAIDTVSDLRIPFGLILSDFYKSEQAIFKLKSAGQYPPFKGDTIGERRASPLRYPTARRKPIPESANSMTPYQYYKKKSVGFDYPLLVRSGALAASLLGASNKGSIANIGKLSLIFGTSINYGIYHQSDAARKKIPLRKFLFIGAEAKQFATSAQMGRLERWLNILNDHILRKLKNESNK